MRNLEPALPPVPEQPPLAPPTASEFANDDARIQAATRAINWRRPSRDDSERNLLDAVSVDDPIEQDASVPPLAVAAAGQLRGIILHKLMEELLGRQVADDVAALTERASILAEQVALPEGGVPDAAELAQVAFDCFHHQSLAPYIALLVPELPLYGSRSDVELVAARADAVALDNGRPTMVVDWKSDKEPTPATRLAYEDQLLQYLELLDIETGALVYMTKRQVQFFHRKRAPAEA